MLPTLAIALLMIPWLVLGAARLARGAHPRIAQIAGPELLVLAAHPDDCAIVAGELAQVFLARGASVRLMYLTCGAPAASKQRASTRRGEAIAAWAGLGVPVENLAFLDFPHTDANADSAFTPQMRTQAERMISSTLRTAPHGAVVVLPAAGELHADHRALRDAAIGAIREASRPDLSVIEAPEYSPYLSIRHSPALAARFLLGAIPGAGRLAGAAGDRGPTFFSGDPGCVLAPDPLRLERKRTLLRCFASENPGDVLVRLFGFPDRWRPCDLGEPDRATRSFVAFDARIVSPAILLCLASLSAGLMALGAAVGGLGARAIGREPWASIIVGGLGAAIGAAAAWKGPSVRRRLALLCVGAGLIAAVIVAG